MDQRKRKEEFYKKIDKMIKGKGKHSRKNSTCYKDLFEKKMDNNEDSLLTLTQILANFFN